MVLALLLIRRGSLVSVDQLVDELWPGERPSDPRTLVHGYVSRLRRALGDASSRLVTRKPGYVLQVSDDEWDVVLFEQTIAEARAARAQGQLDRCIKLFGEALEQWVGEPFADVPPAFAIAAAATTLTELRLSTLEEWFDARLSAGVDPDLVAELTHHTMAYPLREQLVAQLMLAQHRSGRRADALNVFRQTRERMITELGVEPGTGLQQLHQQVLQAAPRPTPVQQLPAQLPMGVPGFVGRQAQLAVLSETTAIAAITGTAGAGKTDTGL